MQEIFIVTAGDSFTDSHLPFISSQNPSSQKGLFEKLFDDRKEMLTADYALKYPYFLIYELIKKNIPFNFVNKGRGSAGNHVIVHYYKKQIQNLLDKGVNPKNIYGTIQLSGLCRATDPVYDIEFDLPNVYNGNWDYINDVNPHVEKYKDVLEKHIENIENIIKWNLEKGIENFNIFFGWAIYFEDELEKYNLKNRFENIDKKYFYYYPYKESKDVFQANCVGYKKLLNKMFNIFDYTVEAGKYGGMTEIAKENCIDNKYPYMSYYDQHLNTFGNYIFYKTYYRDLFKNWNILDDKNEIENNVDLWNFLQFVFKKNFEYFDLTKGNNLFHDVDGNNKRNYKYKFFSEWLDLEKNK